MSPKRLIFFTLAAFIIGTIVLVYIQYNSSDNINQLIEGNKRLLNEVKVSDELKDLEKNMVYIESNVRGAVASGDAVFLQGLSGEYGRIEQQLKDLQLFSQNDSTIKYVDELDILVRQKLSFNRAVEDSFRQRGKMPAERMIATIEGKKLTDSIIRSIQKIDSTRKIILTSAISSIDRSGEKALRSGIILIAIVLAAAGALFWYIINVIQKQERLIKALNESEKKVKEAAQVKENFLANMSHEIRTPMNAILGFTALLGRSNLDEKSKEYVRTIQTSGENLLAIINDILDLSKIEAGMMRIEVSPFSIRALIHSVEVMFGSKAAEKNLQLETTINDDVPDILVGDATRLTQILVNLIGNALKFTKEGGVTVKISNKGQEGTVLKAGILINDTGLGIEKSKQQEIFNRFQQADDTITRNFGGTGLGLSIVRELVIRQNGTIEVDSEPGKGTSFILMIPYTVATVADHIETEPAVFLKPSERPGFFNKRILVAEDNEINQRLIKHLLDEWKLAFDLVQNGKEAIAMLQKNRYDLVLMDIQMPEMDGYTTALEIRNTLGLKIPIIAMTAHALAGEREQCLSYGMNEYISKPIREVLLYKLISRFTDVSPAIVREGELKDPGPGKSYRYINLEYMQEISGGNLEYEKEVTTQFIEAIPDELTAIQTAWGKEDIATLRQQAHNMKTTVSVMGLTEMLQPVLDTLEYEDLTDEVFATQYFLLQTICNGALDEAKKLATL